jgi:hypothetical protein
MYNKGPTTYTVLSVIIDDGTVTLQLWKLLDLPLSLTQKPQILLCIKFSDCTNARSRTQDDIMFSLYSTVTSTRAVFISCHNGW